MGNQYPPLTQADIDRIADLHRQGLSRNEIARQSGRGKSSVTRIAEKLGLPFDREATKVATEAKVADAKARRAQLALDLLGDAERLREQLWNPYRLAAFGGKDHTYAEKILPEPPAAEKLRLMQAVGIAVEKIVAIDRHDAGTGLAEVTSLLDRIAANLVAKHALAKPAAVVEQPKTDG